MRIVVLFKSVINDKMKKTTFLIGEPTTQLICSFLSGGYYAHWRFDFFFDHPNSSSGSWEMNFVSRGRVISRERSEKCVANLYGQK